MLKRIVAVAISTLLVSSVQAQEQTVEGAQKFLAQVLGGFTVDVGRWTHDGKRVVLDRYGKITNVATVDRCKTKITVEYDRFYSSVGRAFTQGRWVNSEWDPWTTQHTINAEELTEVKKTHATSFSLHTAGSTTPVRFSSSTESLTARVTYALDFMRQKCDSTASTGF